jgi:hypothetical protein
VWCANGLDERPGRLCLDGEQRALPPDCDLFIREFVGNCEPVTFVKWSGLGPEANAVSTSLIGQYVEIDSPRDCGGLITTVAVGKVGWRLELVPNDTRSDDGRRNVASLAEKPYEPKEVSVSCR